MSKPRQEGPHGTPRFIDILSEENLKEYEELQRNVGSPNNRYNRNRRFVTLNEIFDQIRRFCQKNDGDDWKRYLVCGICWFDDCIAINTRQLKLLISKCKSSINGAFAKLGYSIVGPKDEKYNVLKKIIPPLNENYPEFRQWTIRRHQEGKENTNEINSKLELNFVDHESDDQKIDIDSTVDSKFDFPFYNEFCDIFDSPSPFPFEADYPDYHGGETNFTFDYLNDFSRPEAGVHSISVSHEEIEENNNIIFQMKAKKEKASKCNNDYNKYMYI